MTEARKAEKAAAKAVDRPIPDGKPEPKPEKLTKAEEDLKKAQEESAEVFAKAQAKASKYNDKLAKEGSDRRVVGGVRHGKPQYFWGNMVPTQALTEDEVAAVEQG